MAKRAKNYDKPDLREQIKAGVLAGDKGGRPGQWSARKAQLVAHEYEAAGGGYLGPPDEGQKHLQQWTAEDWQTKDHTPAIDGKSTHRYLRKEAWDHLSPEQKQATDRTKVAASKRGEQFVPNTVAARRARSAATRAARSAVKPKPAARRPKVSKANARAK